MKACRKIVALAGLSGSGKTTLIGRVEKEADFDHFSASQLLRRHAGKAGTLVSSEELRLGNIDANQIALIDAFLEAASETAKDIIFDCHTVIDGAHGIQEIPSEVFRAIGITGLAFLSVTPATLARRRAGDFERSRPQRTVAELQDHQTLALNAAKRIARDCEAQFVDIGPSPEQLLAEFLTTSGSSAV